MISTSKLKKSPEKKKKKEISLEQSNTYTVDEQEAVVVL